MHSQESKEHKALCASVFHSKDPPPVIHEGFDGFFLLLQVHGKAHFKPKQTKELTKMVRFACRLSLSNKFGNFKDWDLTVHVLS